MTIVICEGLSVSYLIWSFGGAQTFHPFVQSQQAACGVRRQMLSGDLGCAPLEFVRAQEPPSRLLVSILKMATCSAITVTQCALECAFGRWLTESRLAKREISQARQSILKSFLVALTLQNKTRGERCTAVWLLLCALFPFGTRRYLHHQQARRGRRTAIVQDQSLVCPCL